MISKVHKNEQTNKPTNKSSGYSRVEWTGPRDRPGSLARAGKRAKKRKKAELSGVYISEVQHGIIMNSTVLFHILHTLKLLKSTLAQRIGEVQLLGRKTYKFDFRFHFHHYLFIMRSSTLATSTLKSNVIALYS